MGSSKNASLEPSGLAQAERIRASIHQVQRRQWQWWSSAVLITLLLALGIASFAFPGLLSQGAGAGFFFFNQAARGLVGLVLLFNIYTIYQQVQIHSIQPRLASQVDALGRIEARTEEVYQLAVLDPLTGLNNRRSLEKRLSEEILRSQRNGKPLTVLLLDLDGFKDINDTFGHPVGDEVLKHFAERLNKAIRGSDVSSRLGGDEFFVLLPECKPEEVRHVLGRLSGMKVSSNNKSIPITFSAGWTNYIPGESPAELMRRADTSLYANKRERKHQTDQDSESLTPAHRGALTEKPSRN